MLKLPIWDATVSGSDIVYIKYVRLGIDLLAIRLKPYQSTVVESLLQISYTQYSFVYTYCRCPTICLNSY